MGLGQVGTFKGFATLRNVLHLVPRIGAEGAASAKVIISQPYGRQPGHKQPVTLLTRRFPKAVICDQERGARARDAPDVRLSACP